jgi:hypothetical protein
MIRLSLWGKLVHGHMPIERVQDDALFRTAFEAERQRLLPFRGFGFDFRVVPLLSPHALVRYQRLPRGDGVIRNMISSYIAHQATAYPHLRNFIWPDINQTLYKRRLREMFTPLVQATARKILDDMEGTRADKKRLKADVTRHVWSAYEAAVARFRFHYPYSGAAQTPWGTAGFLGLAESEDERRRFDVFLREEGGAEKMGPLLGQEDQDLESTDFTHVLFTRYLEQHLKAWRLETYPPAWRQARTEPAMASLDAPAYGQGTQDSSSGTGSAGTVTLLGETIAAGMDGFDDPEEGDGDRGGLGASALDTSTTALLVETPDAVGPDNTGYFLIEKMARRMGATTHRLRHMEKAGIYVPLRAKDVPGLTPPLPPETRLYPATPETDHALEIALLRSQTHAGRLVDQELTRRQAATMLGVEESQLRSWERSGHLSPEKRGSIVVYSPEVLAAAQALVSNPPPRSDSTSSTPSTSKRSRASKSAHRSAGQNKGAKQGRR